MVRYVTQFLYLHNRNRDRRFTILITDPAEGSGLFRVDINNPTNRINEYMNIEEMRENFSPRELPINCFKLELIYDT